MLRGINVGGYRKVGMPDLVKLYTSLGLVDVRTYIQSGNVVFKHSGPNASSLATRIERGLRDHLGLDVAVFIRSRDEFERIVARYPFAGKDEAKSHVTFLYSKPSRIPADEIGKVAREEEAFSIQGREVYLFCPNGYGRTKLSNGFFERVLKVQATTRNWNTVTTLLGMVGGTANKGP